MLRCVSPELAHSGRFPRCSDSVRLWRHFHRDGGAGHAAHGARKEELAPAHWLALIPYTENCDARGTQEFRKIGLSKTLFNVYRID
jgi:hypothetical protein